MPAEAQPARMVKTWHQYLSTTNAVMPAGCTLVDPSISPKSQDAPPLRTYSCSHCRAHLANHDELISKSFQGSQGRAYLFNAVLVILSI